MALPAAIINDVAALLATEVKTLSAKQKLTGLLTTLVAQFNDPTTSRATLVASLSAFVTQFNGLTTQTNALWKQLDNLATDANAANTTKVELTAAPMVAAAPVMMVK